MKLFYYKDPVGNFGDDLNPLIWYSLAPELFDDDDSSTLIGIGTLINSRAPRKPTKFVFGSGVGYDTFPDIDESWQFCCVRGPLSAQRLGLDNSLALSDPAVLLTQVIPDRDVKRTGMVSFMPHHASKQYANWRGVCEKAGINYIDPADDINEAIFQIRRSRLVIAEAMHSAIVADAFRVPWIPVACYDHILDFKWQDWCQSLGVTYESHRLPSMWDMETGLSASQRLKTDVKRSLMGVGVWSEMWSRPVPKTNRHEVEDQAANMMAKLARDGKQFLSEDARHAESIERLVGKLEELKTRRRTAR